LRISYGLDSERINQFIIDNQNALTPSKIERLQTIRDKSVHEEMLRFLSLVLNNEIITLENISDRYDFKIQFVRKYLLKNPFLNSMDLNINVRALLHERFLFEGDVLKLQSDPEGLRFIKSDEFIDLALSQDDVSYIKEILMKKVFICHFSFVDFVKTCFLKEIDGDYCSVSEDEAQLLVSKQWKTASRIKDELNFKYDPQVYRYLSKKESGYIKLVLMRGYDSDRNPVARYVKMN